MRNPYEVLGMKDTSSKDVIKQRYDILLRRYRAYKLDPENNPLDFDIDEINAAYNNIMGYDLKTEDPNANRKRPVLKLMKIDPGKYDNFWLYNRTKIIIGIISLALIISFINSIVNNVPTDFYIKVMGRFYVTDEVRTELQNELNLKYDEIENSSIDIGNFDLSEDPTMKMALMQKFMAEIASKEVDILICDKDSYTNYLDQGIFLRLDDFVPKEVLDDNEKYYFDGIINETEKIEGHFGINISNIDFFKDFVSVDEKEEMILGVVINTKRLDIVKLFLYDYVFK